MPIYSQICPLVTEEKIFKELIISMNYNRKNSTTPMEASFIDGASLF